MQRSDVNRNPLPDRRTHAKVAIEPHCEELT
jgi:hypothetical protein